ncbi:MAG: hypothetical protein ACQ9MH_02020 [Nitrospinales bacterium]
MREKNFHANTIIKLAFVFIVLFNILGVGSNAFAGGVGKGCSVFYPCDKGLSCQPFVQKCFHSPRWEGESCMAGYPCKDGLTCEAGSHVCRSKGKAGDPCHLTRPCGSGLNCQPGVHKCYNVPRKINQPCSAGYGCAAGLSCAVGKQICEKPELRQCIKNFAAYSAKVEWYRSKDIVYDQNKKSFTTTGSPVQTDNHLTLGFKSCNKSDEYRTAIVRVIGGKYGNMMINIAAGTIVTVAGGVAGVVVCVGTAGIGCPAAVAGVGILAGAAVTVGGSFLPDPEEIAYVGSPLKNVEVELRGTIWKPFHVAGNLRGGPEAHTGNVIATPAPVLAPAVAGGSSGNMEQTCYNMVQGKVAWSRGGSKKWADGNVRNLCSGTTNPGQRVSCFKQGIAAHNNWNKAITDCKQSVGGHSAGGGNPEQQCYNMVQGKVAWSQGGSTKWADGNVRNLCSGTTSPGQRVSCFKKGIAAHNNWNQAINDCKGSSGSANHNAVGGNPEQQCYEMVQGKIPWSRGGSTKWADGNVRNLCSGISHPSRRISCFQNGIAAHNDWNRAINECKG